MFTRCSFALRLLASLFLVAVVAPLPACTTVKTVSQYKNAEKPEKAASNIEKALKLLAEESPSADFRAQLYDSMALLARKFQLKSADPALYAKVRTALDRETRQVSVHKKVPPADVVYLKKLAVTKLAELEEVQLLLSLVQDPADPALASTALVGAFDNASILSEQPALTLSFMAATDRLLERQELDAALREKLSSQREYLDETLVNLPAATAILSLQDVSRPALQRSVLKLLDWDYTLLRQLAAKEPEAAKQNLAALAAIAFPAGADGASPVAKKARAILAELSPLYALEQTVNRAVADAGGKRPVYDYSREVFAYFATKPFLTDPAGKPGAGTVPSPSGTTGEAIRSSVISLALLVTEPHLPKELRDPGYAVLFELVPLEFARALARRAPLCRNSESQALDLLSLLDVALAHAEVAKDRELSALLQAEVAAFAAMPSRAVLDAAAGMLLAEAPEQLLRGMEAILEDAESYSAEVKARQTELVMTLVVRLQKKTAAARGLEYDRVAKFYLRGSGDLRGKMLRFVADREPRTAVRLNHEMLSRVRSTGDPEALFCAAAQAEILSKSAGSLSEDALQLALKDVYDYIAAEADEEGALHVARVVAAVPHPLAREAVYRLAASGGARSASLAALLEAAAGRGRR